MAEERFIRTDVQDAYLLFPETDSRDFIEMPVARFSVSFDLNQLPSAEVVPALGQEIFAGVRNSLADIKEGEAVQLWLKLDGEFILLIDGFVSALRGQDNSTPFSRRLSSVIDIKHRAVILSGAPTNSFAFTQAAYAPTSLMHHIQVFHPLFGTGNISKIARSAQGNEMITSGFAASIQSDLGGQESAYYPGRIIRYIAQLLLEDVAAGASSDEAVTQARLQELESNLDNLINVYDLANFNIIAMDPLSMLSSYSKSYLDVWQTSNNWEALVATARQFLCHVIPFNSSIYIANPFSLDRNPAVVLESSEYLNMSKEVRANLGEPIDGVVLRPPQSDIDQSFQLVFPPQDPAATVADTQRRYYHYRNFPEWLQEYVYMMYGPLTGPIAEANKAAFATKQFNFGNTGATTIREYTQDVGTRLAHVMYADLRDKKATVQISTPFRKDLMPGTTIQLAKTGAQDMDFIGDTLYGMIRGVSYQCDMTQDSGQLNVFINIASIRNTQDNENDALTFDGNPMFEGPWVGIDLEGQFLSVPPAPAIPAPTPNNNTVVDGQKVDRSNVSTTSASSIAKAQGVL